MSPTSPSSPPSGQPAFAPRLIGQAPSLRGLLQRAQKAAPSDLPVVITGESGTGKELLSRFIHDNSRRADRPYVVINCAALPRELLESELFGYERGAFTGARVAQGGWFQAAHGGTLVLDEIGELPLELQPKLLRALESGKVSPVGSRRGAEVDVRIVASTNRELRKQCEAGTFREDLYHRLNGVTLSLPPLRQRMSDIPALVAHFCASAAREQGLSPDGCPALSLFALQRLQEHRWPGNVRELRHLVWRTVALGGWPLDEQLLLDELAGVASFAPSQTGVGGAARAADAPAPAAAMPVGWINIANKTLAEVERLVVEHHVRSVNGNRRAAARMLGISRTTLYERLRETGRPHGLNQPGSC